MVKIYLKGNKKEKENLETDHPEMYKKITKIIDLQRRHMVKDVPTKYVFYLRCCYQKECIHPCCEQGPPEVELKWYLGGLPLSFVPLPSPDPNRPFGQDSCSQRKSACSGHYLKSKPLQMVFLNNTYEGLKATV